MKLKGIFATILALMILCVTSSVFAADVTVGSLSVSADASVLQGNEITVRLNLADFQTTAQYVGISGKIEYDKDKLEYVSGSLSANSANSWTVTFSEGTMVFLAENMAPANVGKNSNLLTLKFKAKSDVEGTASVKATNVKTTDATNFNGGATSITITKPVEEPSGNEGEQQGGQQSGNQNEQQGGNQGEQQGGNQNEQQGGQQSGNQNEQQGEQQSGSQSGQQGGNQGSQQSSNESSKADNTTKKGTLPATGENSYIKVIIADFVAIAVISFIYFIKTKKKKAK